MHLSFEKKCGPPKGADRKVRKKKKFISSRSSWAGAQPGCWGEHHLEQW